MTLFDDNRYNWRETYFVYFEPPHRPKLAKVRQMLKTHAPFLSILDGKEDENENLIAMTIASYEDHAALEITYREGDDVLAEAKHTFHSLKEEASPRELSQLEKIASCQTRFDVHHFEQTAATSAFNVTKIPEIKFPIQSPVVFKSKDVFSRVLAMVKEKFYFDPHSYEQCRHGQIDDDSNSVCMDTERIDPDALIIVLGVLCRISHGIALDPASGIVME